MSFVRELAPHILCIYQEEADNLLLLNLLQWRFWLCRTWVQGQVVQNGRLTSCSGRRQPLPRSNLFLTWTRSPDTCHCFVCLIHCLLPDSAVSVTGSVSLPTSTNDFFYTVSFVYFLLLSSLCSSYIYIYYWSIIAFYSCVSLHCTEKWITICTHISAPS